MYADNLLALFSDVETMVKPIHPAIKSKADWLAQMEHLSLEYPPLKGERKAKWRKDIIFGFHAALFNLCCLLDSRWGGLDLFARPVRSDYLRQTFTISLGAIFGGQQGIWETFKNTCQTRSTTFAARWLNWSTPLVAVTCVVNTAGVH